MNFPFSLSRTIILYQKDRNISSEAYLLHQIESKLSYLKMSVSKLSDNELFFQKTDLFRSWSPKDLLRNMSVSVLIHEERIEVKLKTETILILFFGLLASFTFLFFIPFNIFNLLIPILFICLVGFTLKWVVLTEVKINLEHYLKVKIQNNTL